VGPATTASKQATARTPSTAPPKDQIQAGAGADKVVGGKGEDQISLGAGNDRVDDSDDFRRTGRDAITCGAGTDRITLTPDDKAADKLARDCERFTAAETLVDGNNVFDTDAITVKLAGVRRSGSALLVSVKCNRSKGQPACVISGNVKRAAGGANLGGPLSRLTLKAGKSATLRMVLTSNGRQRVRKGKQVRVLLTDRTSGKKLQIFDRAHSLAQVVVR
jgi:hypothetical protein